MSTLNSYEHIGYVTFLGGNIMGAKGQIMRKFMVNIPRFLFNYIRPALVLCPKLIWDDCREPHFC